MNIRNQFYSHARHWGRATLILLAAILPLRGEEWFNEGKIPHVRLEISDESMAVLRGYHWEGGGNHKERPDVTITVREGTLVYTNVQMHLKGAAGSFRSIDDRPAMTLNFSKKSKGQKFHGLEKLSLNNSVQDSTYMSEILARELFNAAGVPTPRAAHATVHLNDRRLGLYVLVEGWNKPFLKRHFPDPDGNLYDGGFGRDIDQPLTMNSGDSESARSRLKELVEACRSPNTTNRLKTLSAVLDIDRFLTFAAMEILVTHLDGYCIGHNNYRVFHDLKTDRFVFMPHGMDQLFGTFKSTPEYTISPSFKSIASRGVIGARGGRSRYLTRVGMLYTNLFVGGNLTSRVDELTAKLLPVMQRSPQGLARWQSAVSGLKSRIAQRIESVGTQLAKPRHPLVFAPSGEAKLTVGSIRLDSSGEGSGKKVQQDGMEQFILNGPNELARTWPSWHQTVFLGQGSYLVKARVRLDTPEDATGDPVPAVALRLSGVRSGYPRTVSADWTEISYSFEVDEPMEVEVLCELRGTLATAYIDANSLRILRKEKAAE